uniref:Zinc finger protein ZIC 1-like n=1 Tax=Saccoglossus kowalevskii TaxID=10224 RepID=A0ABM0M2L2_SACKO|nr:PREDICTED: zinc finger protein ZIC 1-like [Saccoglossus kowalevskii]
MCGKTFKSPSDLSHHQLLLHSSVSPHTCSYDNCDLAFKSRTQLKEHEMKVHIGTKFPCTYKDCNKVFELERYMKKHLHTHSDVKVYACSWPGCGKRFRDSKNRRVHYYIHTDEKPLKCALCDFRCRQQASLNWHVSNKHKKGTKSTKDSLQQEETNSNQSVTLVHNVGIMKEGDFLSPVSENCSIPVLTTNNDVVKIMRNTTGHLESQQTDSTEHELNMNVVHVLMNMDTNNQQLHLSSRLAMDETSMNTSDEVANANSVNTSDEVADAAATLQSIAIPQASQTVAQHNQVQTNLKNSDDIIQITLPTPVGEEYTYTYNHTHTASSTDTFTH